MSQSKNDIRERNRQNALKSTGPRTPEGKAKSSQNSRTHGMTAKITFLSREDPDIVQARQDEWDDYYKPQSPAAKQLVVECVQATFFSDHVHRTAQSIVVEQILKVHENEAQAARERLEHFKSLMLYDPKTALRELNATAAGCDYLRDRWESLKERLLERGYWCSNEWKEAFRLLGLRSEDDDVYWNPELWLLWRFALCCNPNPPSDYFDYLYSEESCPKSMSVDYPENGSRPAPEDARAVILNMVEGSIDDLRMRAAKLANEIETPIRQNLVESNLVIRDDKQARLFLRYRSEARSAFHKSWALLSKTLKEELSLDCRLDDPPLAVDPQPDAAPATPPEAESRNEATSDPNPKPPKEKKRERNIAVEGYAPGTIKYDAEGIPIFDQPHHDPGIRQRWIDMGGWPIGHGD